MGWKQINGQRYFYRVERVGGRVVTTYCGRGQDAEPVAQLVDSRKALRQLDREAWKADRELADAEDRAVGDWFERIEAVACAALLAAGYRRHNRGEWRRRRDGE